MWKASGVGSNRPNGKKVKLMEGEVMPPCGPDPASREVGPEETFSRGRRWQDLEDKLKLA